MLRKKSNHLDSPTNFACLLLTLTLFLPALLLPACSAFSTLNSSPPDYVKDVVALKEGSDGIQVYFVLADRNGAETTASGNVYLRVTEDKGGFITPKTSTTLYERKTSITRSSFYKAQIGMGAFQRDRIIFSFGRVSYSDFARRPSGDLSFGTAYIEFTTEDGRVLRGESSIIY